MSLFDRIFNNDGKKDEKQKQNKKIVPSTAGAVPVKNTKGEISMETVKVKRYIAGKIPEFSEQNSEKNELEINKSTINKIAPTIIHHERRQDHGKRKIYEPQIIKKAENLTIKDENQETSNFTTESKRKILREELLNKQKETNIQEFVFEDENKTESESEHETSESEEEIIPRLKPVFVPKNNRITVTNDQEDDEYIKMEEKRKTETKEIIQKLINEEIKEKNQVENEEETVITDDDDEEKAFEEWKIRELKRINRDLEEAQQYEAEKKEIQRLRLMTEEERQAHLAANPKIVTNKAAKGEYKYLQKYYHRGAFYLDVEDNVLKQNFAEPTLEDQFDKSVLPRVMQVKNFGKAGRTKYTHLVDQDTSCFEGAWSKKNEVAGQFSTKIGGGMKQIFERPGSKRKFT